jgi:hypothetical protein
VRSKLGTSTPFPFTLVTARFARITTIACQPTDIRARPGKLKSVERAVSCTSMLRPDYTVQFEAMAWERTTEVEERRRAEIRPFSYQASKRTRFRLHLFPRHTVFGT